MAPERPDGFVVAYQVEVVFDTNASRTGYDHVGIVGRCSCGQKLDTVTPASLVRHARSHEPA